jgi:WD40 repeat protein
MGPVYKVHWSPFVENIFLSVSADWTVRLWMIGYNQSCMIFSSSNSKMFFDAIWSPKSATMFFCVSENAIEIWDLSKSTYEIFFSYLLMIYINSRLDPIYITNCSKQLTLTSIAYATDSDVSS